MGLVVHPVVRQQFLAPQPHISRVVVLFLTPGVLLEAIWYWLMRSTKVRGLCVECPQGCELAFFGAQITLVAWIALFLSKRYSAALWASALSLGPRTAKSLVLLTPAILWYLSVDANILLSLWTSAVFETHEQLRNALPRMYKEIWQPLAVDPWPSSVVISSVTSLVVPAFEEIIFTGLLANAVARWAGVPAATTITPMLFTLAHVPRFGLGLDLLPVFWVCGSCVLIRFSSGSLLYAILGHLLVNAVVFLPKWVVAVLYFW